MKKDEKGCLILLTVCLFLCVCGLFKLTMGAVVVSAKPAYEPILWFAQAIWCVLLCIGFLLFRFMLIKDDVLRRVFYGPFKKVGFFTIEILGALILAFAVSTKSTLIGALGAVLIAIGVLAYFMMRNKTDW